MKLAFLFCVSLISATYNITVAQSSLSNGEIHKLSVDESGIHKISHTFLTSEMGKSLSSIDPTKVQLFYAGGGMLPQANAIERANDPIEIPIYISGVEDGSIDNGDAIYFYVEGPEQYTFDPVLPQIELNVFDSKNYFFLKFNEEIGLRIQDQTSMGSVGFPLDNKHVIHRHEIDRENLLGTFSSTEGTGHQWFGEGFANQWEQDFGSFFTSVNPIPGSSSQVNIVFAARSNSTTTVNYNIGGTNFTKSISKTNTGNIEVAYAKLNVLSESIELGNSPSLNIEYNPSESSDKAWLDYIQIVSLEQIKFTNNELIYNLNSLDQEEGFINLSQLDGQLWDVTDYNQIKNCQSVDGRYGFNNSGDIRRFRVFKESGEFASPGYIGIVENQDLHSISDAEMVIVYYKDFYDAAQKLADHRTIQDPLTVRLADIDQIYDEYSSGRKDPTAIRDFAKELLADCESFEYLLLLGDASYDYRGLVSELINTNFVPTMQTKESLHPVNGFPYDDYFAFLSPNEGASLAGALDINVGRLPVKTPEEAMNVIDKIIHYETSDKLLGAWKLNVGFSADDEDNNRHLIDADEIAEMVRESEDVFNIQKVYFDAFVQESTPGGERYPTAKAKLLENLNKGQLIYNYLGHGGPKGLAQERVLLADDLRNMDNFDRLPIIITATCSFTGYDDPAIITAGEEAILNPNGGAVALFTTTRAVLASENARLTESVFQNIFTQEDGQYLRIGELMTRGKNTGVDSLRDNTRKFSLIGDPSMRLNAPQYNIVLDEVNGTDLIEGVSDTLRALETVITKGHVENHLGQTMADFNGKVFLTLYDKPKTAKTLANNVKSQVRSFIVQNNILFKGSATVENGSFSLEFLIPKEIDFNYGFGKLSMYATDGINKDAGGYSDKLIIGGSNPSDIEDNVGPEMTIFMNDESFVPGGITSPDPILLVNLKDQFGINISSTSIGHNISVVLDGDESNPITLNDWYEAETDNFRSGQVRYPMGKLEPGLHKIRIKAWDLCNNSTEKELEFRVVDKDQQTLEHVLNYPNPFTTSTNFSFEHQLADAQLDINISIFTLSGKLVRSINTSRFSEGFRINDIHWDGNDDFGSNLAKGVYLYKVSLRDEMAELSMESDFQKLMILK